MPKDRKFRITLNDRAKPVMLTLLPLFLLTTFMTTPPQCWFYPELGEEKSRAAA